MDYPCYVVPLTQIGRSNMSTATAPPENIDRKQSREQTISDSEAAPTGAGYDELAHSEAERKRERRRWIALAVLCLGQLMMVLDATIVNVALPSIQRELHFSQGNLTWVINGYLVTFGGFLLLGGRMADLFGRRRLFMLGVIGFAVTSLCAGSSQNTAELIASRAAQGLCAAVVSPTVLSLLAASFPAIQHLVSLRVGRRYAEW